MSDAESTLLGQLEFLYGAEAERVLDDLMVLMRSFAGRINTRPRAPLTQKDAVLITYADMVREPGRPPLASLHEFLSDHVSDVVGTVHLLPFYPYSSDDGFSVIDYLEVDPDSGSWDDVARMRADFGLMFDAVVNHISAESRWFNGFLAGEPPYDNYFTVASPDADLSSVFRPRELPLLTEVTTPSGTQHVWTTFSADQVDLNYGNPAVLLAVVDVLLSYVERGADVIRLDAIAFIWKELGTSCVHLPETHCIIQLLRTVLDDVAPWVLMITETNVPHPENVSYFGDGTNEADLVYNFALPPLTLNAFHTGDASVLSGWASGLSAPSDSTTFFNFLASHDGIGVGGARGYLPEDEISALADRTLQLGGNVSYRVASDGSRVPYELNINYLDALGVPGVPEPDELVARRFLTSQAVMLSLQGLPAIYFHSLFGSRGWTDGVADTGGFRTVNREKLDRERIEADLAEAGSLRAMVFDGYRSLLQARASHPAFAPHAAQEVLRLHPSVFAVRRTSGDDSVLCLHNVSSDSVRIDLTDVIGPGRLSNLVDGRTNDATLELGPVETAWLVADAR